MFLLVGVKGTGKSNVSEIHKFASDKENKILYCELSGRQSTDLDDEAMHKKVFNIPWFLSHIRRDTVENMFRKVIKFTEETVTIVNDITLDDKYQHAIIRGCYQFGEN